MPKKRKTIEAGRSKSRCKARTKAGKPCSAAATSGGLCFFHANPNKASELGRIGGRSKRPATGTLDPLPALETATAVRETVARLVADVQSAKLHPRIAASLAPLLSLQLRAIETSSLEQRVAALEKQLAEAQAQPLLGARNLVPPAKPLSNTA